MHPPLPSQPGGSLGLGHLGGKDFDPAGAAVQRGGGADHGEPGELGAQGLVGGGLHLRRFHDHELAGRLVGQPGDVSGYGELGIDGQAGLEVRILAQASPVIAEVVAFRDRPVEHEVQPALGQRGEGPPDLVPVHGYGSQEPLPGPLHDSSSGGKQQVIHREAFRQGLARGIQVPAGSDDAQKSLPAQLLQGPQVARAHPVIALEQSAVQVGDDHAPAVHTGLSIAKKR